MNKKIIVGSLAAAVVLVGVGSVAWAANPNYAGWRAFMGNRAPAVTEKNFDRFTEMQKQVVDGNYSEAAKIRSEIGLGEGGAASGGGCGMHGANGGGCGMKEKAGAAGGCPMAQSEGDNFVDTNNNGICDNHENLK